MGWRPEATDRSIEARRIRGSYARPVQPISGCWWRAGVGAINAALHELRSGDPMVFI